MLMRFSSCLEAESFTEIGSKCGAAKHLQLQQLPGYAADLNSNESIWNDLKRVELGNVC